MVSHTKPVRLHRMVGPKVHTSHITCNPNQNSKPLINSRSLAPFNSVWFPRSLKIWTLESPPFQKNLILKQHIHLKLFSFYFAFVRFLGNQTEGKQRISNKCNRKKLKIEQNRRRSRRSCPQSAFQRIAAEEDDVRSPSFGHRCLLPSKRR